MGTGAWVVEQEVLHWPCSGCRRVVLWTIPMFLIRPRSPSAFHVKSLEAEEADRLTHGLDAEEEAC